MFIGHFALGFAAPPPPATATGPMLAGPALAMWLLVLWAWWVDNNRVPAA